MIGALWVIACIGSMPPCDDGRTLEEAPDFERLAARLDEQRKLEPMPPFARAPVSSDGDPSPRPRSTTSRRLRIAAISVGSGAGVAAVLTAVFGGLTLRERRRFGDAVCAGACASATYPEGAERRFYAYRTTTNVMLGVSAGLAATATALGLAAVRLDRAARVSASATGLRLRF